MFMNSLQMKYLILELDGRKIIQNLVLFSVLNNDLKVLVPINASIEQPKSPERVIPVISITAASPTNIRKADSRRDPNPNRRVSFSDFAEVKVGNVDNFRTNVEAARR